MDSIEARLLCGELEWKMINKVTAGVLKWSRAEGTEKERYDRALNHLIASKLPHDFRRESNIKRHKLTMDQLEFNISKADDIIAMNEKEIYNFAQMHADIGLLILSTVCAI